MEKNYAKKQKGITLIALVVTIVILLILSGISLNIVLGNNGIITKAQEAKITNNHSTVYEAMQLQYDNYYTESTTGENDADFITDLKNKSILDENMDVNVETLVGKKLSTGNGSNLKDVYVVEKDETGSSYRLKYYGKTSAVDRNLGIIGYEKEGADEPSDPEIFDFDPGTGAICLKYARSGYERNNNIPESGPGVTKLKKIVIPAEIDGVKVTRIGMKKAIYGLESVGFASPYVEEIVLPDTITYISAGAFAGCINLKKINIPDSVKSIAWYAFYRCNSLEKINIPNSVTGSIENNTFGGCISLKSIKLSKNTKEIRDWLNSLPELQEVNIDADAINYTSENGILYNKDKTKLICYPANQKNESYKITDSLKEIRTINSKNLKSITVSQNTDNIDSIIGECPNLENIIVDENNQNYLSENGILFDKAKTTLIIFPENNKQENLIIDKKIQKINCDLNYCVNLKEINVDNENEIYSSEEGVLFDKDKTMILCYPGNKDGESYTIPTSVTSVGSEDDYLNVFIGNKKLKNITITKNVSNINCSFSYCENLQNINVDSENQKFASEDGVLFDKAKTELLEYPSGRTQTSYTIPDNVEILYWFSCINLKELVIPSSVNNIGYGAFYDCPNLKVIIKKGSSLTMEDLEKSGLSQSQVTFEN